MYIWTAVVISYIERCTISGVVTDWYFHRDDPSRIRHDRTKKALRRSLTYSFGSIALAALLLAVVRFAQFGIRMAKRVCFIGVSFGCDFGKVSRMTSAPWVNFLLGCFAAMEGLVQGINGYALVYIAYSGRDFVTSAKNCAGLFRRNLLSALLTGIVESSSGGWTDDQLS